MGRECGYLALVSAITSGAELCIIPEIEPNMNNLEKRLSNELNAGRNYLIAIVTEGTGKTETIKEWIENRLNLDSRISILSHIQRGGNPTVYDRLMGFEFIDFGLNTLLKNSMPNGVVTYKNGYFSMETIDKVVSGKYRIKENILKLAYKMSGI